MVSTSALLKAGGLLLLLPFMSPLLLGRDIRLLFSLKSRYSISAAGSLLWINPPWEALTAAGCDEAVTI